MNKYFKDVHTLEELRRQYRDLLKKYHPTTQTAARKQHKKSMQNMTDYLKY